MKVITACLLALTLSGCATMDLKGLENRVACTAAKDQLLYVSMWGMIGVASKVSDADRAAVCK